MMLMAKMKMKKCPIETGRTQINPLTDKTDKNLRTRRIERLLMSRPLACVS